MTSTETLKELNEKRKKSVRLAEDIILIVNNLNYGELTLTNIIAEEDRLKDTYEDLQQICKEIIDLRQYLAFEMCGEELERTLKNGN